MRVAMRLVIIVFICLLNGSHEITIRRGKNLVYKSESKHLTSNVNTEHRDWVNEIKEEIKLSKLARPRADGEETEEEKSHQKVLIFGSSGSKNEICQRRMEMVVSKMYDERIECKETFISKCVKGYTTKYEPTKVRQCTENFKKSCHITYFPTTVKKEVKICQEKYTRECNSKDNEETNQICVTVPSTVCISSIDSESLQEEVKCTSETKEICGPDTCSLKKEEVCIKEERDVVQEVPEEKCIIQPKQTCRNVTKLVPNLLSKKDCLDIPKEVCETLKTNLRTIKKPVSNIICRESKGGWGKFSEWSTCGGKCGEGTQFRERTCEKGDCKGFATQTRNCDTGIECEEKEEIPNDSEPIEIGGIDESSTDDEDTSILSNDDNTSPLKESDSNDGDNTSNDEESDIPSDDNASPSDETDSNDGGNNGRIGKPRNSFDCARNGIRFISNDKIKSVLLPPNGETKDKVRLCQILCVQKDGCQFYNTNVDARQSSCILYRAISDIVEGAKGYVGGLKHCLEAPVPVESEEIIEDA